MQYILGTESGLLIYCVARDLLTAHTHGPLYFLQQILWHWGVSVGFNRNKSCLKLNYYYCS